MLAAGAAWATPPNVAVVQWDGSNYDRNLGGQANVVPRQRVAQTFYLSHDDAYDFIVVFPNFSVDFGAETAGLNLRVRNDVDGIGVPSLDLGASFGSARRLQSYIDMGSLRSLPFPLQARELEVLAHEIGHQWLAFATRLAPFASLPSNDLLGEGLAHWSFFFDDDGSVMYGSKWRDNGNGTFSAVESARRYSALDLYLMGFLEASEVPDLRLLHPQASVSYQASSIPPPDGTTVAATAEAVPLAQLLQALGPRRPSAAGSPHAFRAAFVILAAPGQPPTAAQLDYVDTLRRAFENDFFFLTRGRGIMETQLVEAVPPSVSSNPGVASGLAYLLAQQQASGAWRDDAATAVRDTQEALETLRLFSSATGVPSASARGGGFIATDISGGTDSMARRALGVAAARLPFLPIATALPLQRLASASQTAGYGLGPGYQPSILDSVLSAQALLASGAGQGSVAALVTYLLAQQNADGGWPLTPGGPSRIEATGRVLGLLAEAPRSALTVSAATEGAIFLQLRHQPNGSYFDDAETAAATSRAMVSLAQWQRLAPANAAAGAQSLLGRQLADGSWQGSVLQTALALRALRTALTPNLVLASAGSALSAMTATDGETVMLTVQVRNDGFAAASAVPVQAFDSGGVPFGPPTVIASLAPGASSTVSLALDTTGHAGSTQVFAVANANGTVDELRTDDNRAAFPLFVQPPPGGTDLFVAQGSVVAAPAAVSSLPSTVTVSARVGNLGLTAAAQVQVQVALVIQGQTVATALVDFGARSMQTVTLAGAVTGPLAQSAVPVTVVVDPANLVTETRKDNNSASALLPVVPSVDLRLTQLVLTPPATTQGGDVDVMVAITNAGTTDAMGATRSTVVQDAAGAVVAALPVVADDVPAGQTVVRHATWRANAAGTLRVVASANHPLESPTTLADNSATAALQVSADGRANLLIPPSGLTFSPSRPLQSQPATALAVVGNSGADAGAFLVDFYLGNPDAGARFARQAVPGLAGGQRVTVSGTFTDDAPDASFVFVAVNPDLAVAEFDTSDNTALLAFTPVPIPDLVVGDGDLLLTNAFPRPGDVVGVTVSVYNAGGQAAQGFTVQLFQGAPDAGGVPLGVQTVASLAGGARTNLPFSWNTAGLTGTVSLTAAVNAGRTQPESRYDNNTGSRAVTLQTGPLAVSNPYFSPNGDGVQDTTTLYYQLPAQAVAEVRIADRFGTLVRTIRPVAGAASVDWDGRNEAGGVVRDGPFTLTLSVAGLPVGSTLATVDTNRLPFEDALARLDLQASQRLGDGVGQWAQVYAAPMPDEANALLAVNQSPYAPPNPYGCGFFLRDVALNAPPQKLTPPNFMDCARESLVLIAVSPDGSRVAYVLATSGGSRLRVYSFATQATQDLGGFNCPARPSAPTKELGPVFSPDGQSLAVADCDAAQASDVLFEVSLATGARRALATTSLNGAESVRYLPDGSGLTFGAAGQVFLVRPGAATSVLLPVAGGPPFTGAYAVGADSHSVLFPSSQLRTSTDRAECLAVCARAGRRCDPTETPVPCVLTDARLIWRLDLASRLLSSHVVDTSVTFSEEVNQLADSPSRTALALNLSVTRDVTWAYSQARWSLSSPVGSDAVQMGPATQLFPTSQADPFVWSPRGAYVLQATTTHATLANLPVDLSAFRPPGATALTIVGLAQDINFGSYQVAVRPQGSTASPTVLVQSAAPATYAELTQWTPPGPGIYEVSLTARDLGGNVRHRTVPVGWNGGQPAIANVRRNPDIISPNGDGVLDTTLVEYTATAPVSTDFQVTTSSGRIVQHFARTHLGAGAFSLVWDGRTAAGGVAPDGDYLLRVEAVSLPIAVDTVPPTAAISGGQLELVPRLAVDSSGGLHQVPAVFVPILLQMNDLHPGGAWQLERTPLGSAGVSVVLRGVGVPPPGVPQVNPLLTGLRGAALRLKASDLAGNTGVSAPFVPAEGLYLMGAGSADAMHLLPGFLTLPDGTRVPRVDALNVHPQLSNPFLGAYWPHPYAFHFDTSITNPIVGWRLAYRTGPSAPWIDDTANLTQDMELVLEWDGRTAPAHVTDLRFEATDSLGVTFTFVAPFAQPRPPVVFVKACPGVQTSDLAGSPFQVDLTLHPGDNTLIDRGGLLRFVPTGSAAQESVASFSAVQSGEPTQPWDSRGTVDTSSFQHCAYDVDFDGTAHGDQPPTPSFQVRGNFSLGICHFFYLSYASISPSGSAATIRLSSSLSEPMTSADILVEGTPMGSVPGFRGISAPLTFPLQGFPTRRPLNVTALVHLQNGQTELMTTSGPPGCSSASSLEVPSGFVAVRASLATAAPTCQAQQAVFDVTVTASVAPWSVTALSLQLVAADGSSTGIPLQGVVTGLATATGAAVVPTSGFTVGDYTLLATTTDNSGHVTTGRAPLKVDRTQPFAVLRYPVAGTVCPTPAVDASGHLFHQVTFQGTVSDDNLASYELLMTGPALVRIAGPTFNPPAAVTYAGPLMSWPTDGFPSGDYSAVLVATDVSGSSTCSPPAGFHLQSVVSVAGLTATPALFSPDGDGVLDTSNLAFAVDSPAQLTLSATAATTGATFQILQASVLAGPRTLQWLGTSSSGGVLPDGTYQLRVDAVDTCGNHARPQATTVEIDTTPPVARLDAPAAGAVVRGTLTVTGEASDANFKTYELQLGAGAAPAQYQRVGFSSNAASGVLGAVDTSTLAAGTYTLRLVASDTVGHTTTTGVTFSVASPRLITALFAAPAVISLSGNGTARSAAVTYGVNAPSTVALDVAGAADAGATLFAGPFGPGTAAASASVSTLGPLPDGDYQVRLVASVPGTSDFASAPLTVDNTPPAVALTSPLAGGFVRGDARVVGLASDVHLASWSLADVTGPPTTLATGASSVTGPLLVLPALSDGPHTLALAAVDTAGNHASTSVAFTADSTPPVVAIGAPRGGSVLSGRLGPAPVTAQVQEVNPGQLAFTVAVDGGSPTPLPSAGLTAQLPAAALPDGPATLTATATDLAGNAGSATAAVVIDNTPPVAQLTLPAAGGILRAGDAFRGTVSDTNFASYTLELSDGPPATAYRFATIGSGTAPVTAGTLAALASLPADGAYTARLTAVDAAGNTTVTLVGFQLRATPPQPPLQLTASASGRDVTTQWTASPSPTVVGYRVLRQDAAGTFVLVSTGLVPGLSFVDPALPDGRYAYQVVAVDDVGLASAPSNTAQAQVHATPPVVSLASPLPGAEIAGPVSVTGTATAAWGLAWWRLSLGSGAAPAAFVPVAASSLPVVSSALGTFDASALPEGSTVTVRLEAQDVYGNAAQAQRALLVHNAPPAAPVLLTLTPVGATASATWRANTEPDLAGYLLYRNGVLVNAPPNVSVTNLLPYVLPVTQLAYLDTGVPDGTFSYQLRALDAAGNLSAFSNALSVTFDNRTPSAVIVLPATMARVPGPFDLVAESPDLDIARVQFEARAGGQPAFAPLGLAGTTSSPFRLRVDPALLPSPVLELRAVATDFAGHTDPSPGSIFVFYDVPLAAPAVQARVDGSTVSVSWTDTNVAPALAGYTGNLGFAVPLVTGGATASSTEVLTSPQAPFSSPWTTPWRSSGPAPHWWQLAFVQPTFVDYVAYYGGVNETADVSLLVEGAWIPVGRNVTWQTVQVSPPLVAQAMRLDFTSTPLGFAQLVAVGVAGGRGLTTGRSQALTEPLGLATYSVSAVSRFGSLSDAGQTTALVYVPALSGPAAVAAPSARLTGLGAAADASVEIDVGAAAVATAQADPTGAFAVDVALDAGANVFTARATDGVGNRSLPSAPVTVVYEAAPDASVTLSLVRVVASDVTLGLAVQGDPAHLATIEVRRAADGGQETAIAQLPPTATGYTDLALPNGDYRYRALPLNAQGLAGAPSNTVQATVAVATPSATALAVTAPPVGGRLALGWSYAGPATSSFIVERAPSATGAFAVVSAWAPPTATHFDDFDVADGTTYFYRVTARDALGNLSAPSNVASGTPALVPSTPVFDAPTTAGHPVTVTTPATSVGGTAAADSVVSLVANGAALATVRTAPALRPAFAPSVPVTGTLTVSPDGSLVAYAFTPAGSTTRSLAVESVATHQRWTFLAPSGIDVAGALVFSPDGSRVAAEVLQYGWDPYVYVATPAAGTFLRAADPSLSGTERAPDWASDSSRLVYLARRYAHFPADGLVAVDVATNTESYAQDTAALQAKWLPNGQDVVVLAAGALTRRAPPAWVPVPLVGLTSGTELAVSARNQVAVAAGAGCDVLLLDAASGALRVVAHEAAAASSLAFSPDGWRLTYLSAGVAHEVRLSTGDNRALGRLAPGFLVPAQGGALAYTPLVTPPGGSSSRGPGSLLARLGRFDVAAQLSPGLTVFGATAAGGTGVAGPRASPIEVTLDASWLADLSIAAVVSPALPAATQPANAYVTVRNLGDGGAPGPSVTVAVLSPDGGVRPAAPFTFAAGLNPGDSAVAAIAIDVSGLSGPQQLLATVDPAQLIPDSNRANNTALTPFTVASTDAVAVAVTATPSSVAADGTTTASVSVLNPGPRRDVSLHLALVSPDGAEVMAAGPDSALPLPAMGSAGSSGSFNVGRTLAGPYALAASLLVDGGVVASAQAPVTIVPDTSAALRLVSARASSLPTEAIELDSTVTNLSKNAALAGASLELRVTDTAGVQLYASSQALPVLPLGGTLQRASLGPALHAPPGDYPAQATVTLNGVTLATATATLHLTGQAIFAGQLSIPGAATTPARVPAGQDTSLAFTVQNVGNAAAPGTTLHLGVLGPAGLLVLPVQDVPLAPLGVGLSATGVAAFATRGLPLGQYLGVLSADGNGATQLLAQAVFRVADVTPPHLAAANLVEGEVVQGALTASVRATDDFSGALAVRVSVDGAPASQLAATSGSALNGLWAVALTLSPDGAHTLVFSAVDREGNDGLLTPLTDDPLTVHVVSDATPPVITVTGVTDGQLSGAALAPAFTATDLHLATVAATLDGAPFGSGSPVLGDGDHVLVVQAVDAAANTATAVVRFAIDTTPPLIAFAGFTDGEYSPVDVRPEVFVFDAHLVSWQATLDFAPLAPHTVVSVDGVYVVRASALDAAGNRAQAQGTFTVDKTPPSVTLGGFTDGAWVRGAVTPTYTASDTNLATVTATLNGVAFASGTPVTADGDDTLVVTATDRAGNATTATGTFHIDTVPPVVTLGGFTDGAYVNTAVTPTFVVTDLNLATVTATLNGAAFASGTRVVAEGHYTLVVTGVDKAGNSTTTTGAFTVDTTPPTITVTGVAEGVTYDAPLTPTFSAQDASPFTVSATLSGAPFASGTPITVDGVYTLVVTAVDAAGNRASVTVHFTLLQVRYDVTVQRAWPFSRVLALVDTGACLAAPAERVRVEDFLTQALASPTQTVTTTWDETTFLTGLRSGAYDLFVLLGLSAPGQPCDEDDDGPGPEGCHDAHLTCTEDALQSSDGHPHSGSGAGASHVDLDGTCPGAVSRFLAREVTERVFSAQAGLVVQHGRARHFERLDDVLGAEPDSRTQAASVAFQGPTFTALPALQLPAPSLVLELDGAQATAQYPGATRRAPRVAAAANAFGNGRAVSWGFDLTLASPAAQAPVVLQRAADWVRPPQAPLAPLAVAGVEVDLTNLAAANQTRVRTTLPPALGVESTLPQATATGTTTLEWLFPLARGQATALRFFVRLPDAAGVFTTSTEVAALRPSGTHVFGTYPFALAQAQTGQDELLGAQLLALGLPAVGPDAAVRARLLADLAHVQARAVTSRAAIEFNLRDLLDAAEETEELHTVNPTPLRLSLDEVIRYWEARWSTY